MKELNIKKSGFKINGVEFYINTTSPEYIEKYLAMISELDSYEWQTMEKEDLPKAIRSLAGHVEKILGEGAIQDIFGEDYSPGIDDIMQILEFIIDHSAGSVDNITSKFDIENFK